MLVSDWNNDRVYRSSASGKPLSEFDSEGLRQIVSAAKEARQRYELYKYLGVLLFALALGGLMVRALAVNMTKSPSL